MSYVFDNSTMAALEKALDVLGESSKQTVFFHMAKRGVDPGSAGIEEIEAALYAMLGSAAAIIMDSMRKELEGGS